MSVNTNSLNEPISTIVYVLVIRKRKKAIKAVDHFSRYCRQNKGLGLRDVIGTIIAYYKDRKGRHRILGQLHRAQRLGRYRQTNTHIEAELSIKHGGGRNYVSYNNYYLGSDVAVRYGYFIYHGWSASYSACSCYHRVSG